jgi:hypothetical protein
MPNETAGATTKTVNIVEGKRRRYNEQRDQDERRQRFAVENSDTRNAKSEPLANGRPGSQSK